MKVADGIYATEEVRTSWRLLEARVRKGVRKHTFWYGAMSSGFWSPMGRPSPYSIAVFVRTHGGSVQEWRTYLLWG
jgi:hypothetical protein